MHDGMTGRSTAVLTRPWLGFAIATALWLAQASAAQASGVISIDKDDFETGVGAMLLIGSAVGFGAMDLMYFAHDKPVPSGLAVVQIVVGGVLVPMSALRSSHPGVVIGAGISSAWFSGHGIYSVAGDAERQREAERRLATERAQRAACAHEPGPRRLLCLSR